MHLLFNASYYLFFVVLAAIGVLFVATLFPIPGNIQVKVVLSDSMEPAIRVGSVVIVTPIPLYKVGDIITFGGDTKNKIPTTHRIVEGEIVEGTFLYTTKGDSNEDPDVNKVRQDEVIGKVLVTIPFAGFLIDFTRKPFGFALLVGIPALVIIYDEASSMWSKMKKIRKNKRLKKVLEEARIEKEERLKRKKLRAETTYQFIKAPGPKKKKKETKSWDDNHLR